MSMRFGLTVVALAAAAVGSSLIRREMNRIAGPSVVEADAACAELHRLRWLLFPLFPLFRHDPRPIPGLLQQQPYSSRPAIFDDAQEWSDSTSRQSAGEVLNRL